MGRCPGDNSFGPTLGPRAGECYDFDFTLVFEESIFAIGPYALAIVLTALRLRWLLRPPASLASPVVHWPLVRASKLVRILVTRDSHAKTLTTEGCARCPGVFPTHPGSSMGYWSWCQDTDGPAIGSPYTGIDPLSVCSVRHRTPPVHTPVGSVTRLLDDGHPT